MTFDVCYQKDIDELITIKKFRTLQEAEAWAAAQCVKRQEELTVWIGDRRVATFDPDED